MCSGSYRSKRLALALTRVHTGEGNGGGDAHWGTRNANTVNQHELQRRPNLKRQAVFFTLGCIPLVSAHQVRVEALVEGDDCRGASAAHRCHIRRRGGTATTAECATSC